MRRRSPVVEQVQRWTTRAALTLALSLPILHSTAAGADEPTSQSDAVTLTQEALPSFCFEPLSNSGTTFGTWDYAFGCGSWHRGENHYAIYYRLTVSKARTVRINLSSSAADALLYLSAGGGGDGPVIASDDDSGPGSDALIERFLTAGTYTIEATTFVAFADGDFRLDVEGAGGSQQAAVRWTIQDGCSDGKGLRLRFFDKTKGKTYPGNGAVYRIAANKTKVFQFNAARTSQVCLGAESDPPDGRFWCLGIAGNKPPYGACCARVPATGSLVKSGRVICGK